MHSPVEDDSLDLSFHPAKWQLDCRDRKRKIKLEKVPGTQLRTHSLIHRFLLQPVAYGIKYPPCGGGAAVDLFHFTYLTCMSPVT